MTLYTQKRMKSEDVSQLMVSVAKQLKKMGYAPDAYVQFAGSLMLAYGFAMIDTHPEKINVVEFLTDQYCEVLDAVISGVREYRDSQDAKDKDKVHNT